ncbi:MAG: cytochrome c [Gammaproteobacteria bacterium]|nr:cytochrome c [Gammaproteobacteria bacterium]
MLSDFIAPQFRIILAMSLICAASPALAQESRAARQIKYRVAAYEVLGAQAAVMGGMSSGRIPYDAKAFQLAAERAAFMATVVPDLFPVGSDAASAPGVKTQAKPDIWQNLPDFEKLMKNLQLKSAALVVAAKAGNLESAKVGFDALRGACKACHDKYKVPD